jgi:hypothetical protein
MDDTRRKEREIWKSFDKPSGASQLLRTWSTFFSVRQFCPRQRGSAERKWSDCKTKSLHGGLTRSEVFQSSLSLWVGKRDQIRETVKRADMWSRIPEHQSMAEGKTSDTAHDAKREMLTYFMRPESAFWESR